MAFDAIGEGALRRALDARGDGVALASGLQFAHQPARVAQRGEALGIHRHRVLRALDQRDEAGLRTFQRREDAGAGDGQVLQAGGTHVVLVQGALVHVQPQRVALGALALAHGDGHGVGTIRHHLARVQLQAPGLEQRFEVGRAVLRGFRRHWHAGIGFAIGVDERQQLAAAQDELVDGVERLLRQLLGMHQQQYADILGDLVDFRREALQVELLADILQHHPRRTRLLRLHVEAAVHLQIADQPDHRPLRLRQALHQAADVVFEEFLVVQREERDGLGIVQRIGAGQTEVDLLAALVQRHRLQAELGGAVFLFGERLRIDDMQPDLAASLALVGLEQLLDTPGVVAQRHEVLGALVGIEEVQVDRLLQLAKDLLRPVGDGVQALLGQVQARAGEGQPGDHVEGQEQQGDDQQPGPGVHQFLHDSDVLSRLSSGRPPPPWRPARRRSG
ncbi:hypothetical protein D3C76_596210 [compost metagenome]